MSHYGQRRGTIAVLVAASMILLPHVVNAQDEPEPSGGELTNALEPLPAPMGECGGAELRVLSVDAPFGQPLGDELVLGSAEVEYLLPAGAMNPFISLSIPEGSGIAFTGAELLELAPDAQNIRPDATYSTDAMTATILDAAVGEPTAVTVELVGGTESTYIEKWGFQGLDLTQVVPPPYTFGHALNVFVNFELDGAQHSWFSSNSDPDCQVFG